MAITTANPQNQNPLDTGPVSARQYGELATAELEHFLALLEQLEPADWGRPTACSLWDVRDVVAHQAGHIQSGAGLWGTLAQSNPFAIGRYLARRMNMLDAVNQRQVDMRRPRPIERVVAELREGTPGSIAARQRIGRIAGSVRVPVPPGGTMPMRTLLWRIFPRDMWIHRLDIADATGRPFAVTAVHDGVLTAMAVEDVARWMRKRAHGMEITLHLPGPAGGHWQLSEGPGQPVHLEMRLEDFLRRSSGRLSPEAALERVSSSAPPEPTIEALRHMLAPY